MRSCLYVPVWLALALVVMSCASTPRIANWQHKPFHPDNNENIEFRIQASDTGGVATVKLSLFEYELYVGAGGMKSARPRPGGTWGVVKTWNLSPAQTAVDLTHTVSGFPASSKITYKFDVTNTDGRSRSVEARFDAGTSPWPNSSITLWSSTPRSPSKTIDIMLLPDEDYNGNWDEFLDDVREMIYEGYHTNNMITGNRDKYTFYYSRAEGDAEGWPNWKLDIPSSVASLPHIDVFCIVHTLAQRCTRRVMPSLIWPTSIVATVDIARSRPIPISLPIAATVRRVVVPVPVGRSPMAVGTTGSLRKPPCPCASCSTTVTPPCPTSSAHAVSASTGTILNSSTDAP